MIPPVSAEVLAESKEKSEHMKSVGGKRGSGAGSRGRSCVGVIPA